MYKPPQNSNRVKSIKSKFENIENLNNQTRLRCTNNNTGIRQIPAQRSSEPLSDNFANSQASSVCKHRESSSEAPTQKPPKDHHILLRQHSDPLKRNIRRTPAFRVDRNSNKEYGVEDNDVKQRTLFESKVKQFHSVKGCERNLEIKNEEQESMESTKFTVFQKANNDHDHIICDSSNRKLKHNIDTLCYKNDFNENSGVVSETTLERFCTEKNKTDYKDRNSQNRNLFLTKSKSSLDFQYLRTKFDNKVTSPLQGSVESRVMNTELGNLSRKVVMIRKGESNQNITEDDTAEAVLLKNIDLSLLYTEPIPKSLRVNNSSESSTTPPESSLLEPKIESIYTQSTLQLTDSDKKEFLESLKNILKQDLPGGLTDSLKVALKKPLPNGPAPKKPPRTFQHTAQGISTSPFQKERCSFLHIAREWTNGSKSKGKKGDPKYMLSKLEMALKNNKLRARKKLQSEVSTTSGEDSDDSLLFESKSCHRLQSVQKCKESNANMNSNGFSDSLLSDFNCFTTFGCTNPAYERITEPTCSFFVPNKKDPIYAEPNQNKVSSPKKEQGERDPSKRGSLYYMSTLLVPEDIRPSDNIDGLIMCSGENSSLSSFTSDLDSNPSPVTDDPHAKIRYLIENFESRRQTLPKVARSCTTPLDSSSRVEVLKNSLKTTLDRSFNSDFNLTISRESDLERNDEGKVARMVARFHTFQKSAPKYQQPKINTDTLFYCCLVIERVRDCAQIKFKFPPNVDVPRNIEHLCFPESPDSAPLEGTSAAQTYTLLMTSEMGDRTYGYCRRVLPEGSTHCLPLAYCIISKYRAPRFYKKILLELESRHGMQNKFRDELISQFYYKKFPKPGESISVSLCYDGGKQLEAPNSNCANVLEDRSSGTNFVQEKKIEIILTMHVDTRYEDADLKKLHKLPADILLKIFSSLLLERKVILISSAISELSSCVDSLQSILYPFTWYHTFIPILPESLWDIVESPTPVVCGVLAVGAMQNRYIENGIVVNLDTKSVLIEEGDEMKILSGSLHKIWRQFITLANNTKSMEYVYSVYLADAYLNVFICCFKNYKQYIVNGQFLKEELLKNAKTKGIRRFLKMFIETCMFHAFVDAALNNPESLTLFDKKVELYGSDESRIVLDKLVDWHR